MHTEEKTSTYTLTVQIDSSEVLTNEKRIIPMNKIITSILVQCFRMKQMHHI